MKVSKKKSPGIMGGWQVDEGKMFAQDEILNQLSFGKEGKPLYGQTGPYRASWDGGRRKVSR